MLTNPSTPRWLTLGRLLQQQRGSSRSSANNHNPRRPICRPAPLFRLPPPPLPPLQLMMIAPALSLSLSCSRYLFLPLFYPFDPLFWHNSPRGSIRIRRMGRRKLGLPARDRERRSRTGLLLAGPPPQCHGVQSISVVEHQCEKVRCMRVSPPRPS